MPIKHRGDESDYLRRKKEGTIGRKFRKLKKIKILRKKKRKDPRKCPKCGKIGELKKRTPYGSHVHYTYKCLKCGSFYSFTEGKNADHGSGSDETIK